MILIMFRPMAIQLIIATETPSAILSGAEELIDILSLMLAELGLGKE